MSKKRNAARVLIAAILDICIGYAWYLTLWSTKTAPYLQATIWGAMMVIFTAVALGLSYTVYHTAIAEEKKFNGALVLVILIINIFVYCAWYFTLYPTKVMSHFEIVGTSALLSFYTLVFLALNAIIYAVAIAEG